jgi:hypothetical protein
MNKQAHYARYIYLITIIFSLAAFSTKAQNNTSNPYSMYGLGELRSQTNAANAGMGNAGLGLPSGSFLNVLNPASYTGIDSLNFLFEIGVDGQYSEFESQGDFAKASHMNLSYMAMGFRINKWAAAGLGLNPYSNSGYEINSGGWIEGTSYQYPLDIMGSGNISRAYVGLAFTPVKNLSLGVKPSFLFGKLVQTQYHDLSIIGSSSVSNVTTDFFHNFFIEFGAQYTLKLKPGDLSLGVMYNPGTALETKRNHTTYDDAGNTYEYRTENNRDNFLVPAEYGIGLAFKSKRNMVYALDAGTQKWSNYDYSDEKSANIRLQDNPYVRAGFEYTPTENYLAKYYKRINYRLGFRYAKSYLDLRSTNQKEICVSLGFGLPINIQNQLSRIDISFEGGQNGTTENRLIQETFLRVRVGLSLRDFWFQHRIYN